MKHLVASLFVAFILCALVACDRAPSGVIPESKMEKIVVDLGLAEAYIESHFDQFPDDSSRLVLKQSVFMKYGVTPEMYDSSLVWYARNMDVYIKVYDNAIGRLQRMRDKTSNEAEKSSMMAMNEMDQQPVHRVYDNKGDSADLWQGPRRWIFTPGMKSGFIPFDIEPDKEYAMGDRYTVQFKLKPVRSSFKLHLAVEYQDGASTTALLYACNDGWNELVLQSDSTRMVRRIYGFIGYDMVKGDVAYVDSLAMLRTHVDSHTYMAHGRHILVERVKRDKIVSDHAGGGTDAPRAVPVVKPHVSQGHFVPKEGVNKSSAERHIQSSPNAAHLPSRR